MHNYFTPCYDHWYHLSRTNDFLIIFYHSYLCCNLTLKSIWKTESYFYSTEVTDAVKSQEQCHICSLVLLLDIYSGTRA